jgi:hypothetical protein
LVTLHDLQAFFSAAGGLAARAWRSRAASACRHRLQRASEPSRGRSRHVVPRLGDGARTREPRSLADLWQRSKDASSVSMAGASFGTNPGAS